MARHPGPDQLDGRAVHPGGVPAGHGGQAADGRRPGRAGVLRRARRGRPGPSGTRRPSRSTSSSSSSRAGSWPFPTRCGSSWPSRPRGMRVAAASSSKNAKLFLERIRLDTFAAEQRLDYDFIHDGMTLEELFDADISGRDFPRGKPDPTIFLTAAEELGLPPSVCFVVEDATSGVQAAKAGGMAAIGVARLGDRDLLAEAGADLVVTTLDDVSLPALAEGRLQERPVGERDPAAAHRAAAERVDAGLRRLRPRPPGAAGGAVRAGQRVLRHPRRPARGRGRRRPLPGHLRRRPVQPGRHRGRRARRWRTRTWSTCPTGCRCGSGSPAGRGSTSQRRRRGPPPRAGHAPGHAHPPAAPGGTPRAGGPAWSSAGSSA